VVPTRPVGVRLAATVLLLRDAAGPAPLQVFLQRRVDGMAFAPGMTVFPGGAVDATDRYDPARWSGPDPRWWAHRLGCTPDEAAALVYAAVREVFEECGVLLAGSGPVEGVDLQAARADVVHRRRTLGDVLATAALRLRADLLGPWVRWVTPETEPRRYDTAFFVARLPEGQEADSHTTEAVEAAWWYPADALEGRRRGDLMLMRPTRHTLEEIAGHPDVASVLDAARERVVRTHRPVQRRDDGRDVAVREPLDLGPGA
jgi:8-oxo-dGTP pyrophosphatase MutT (NUDIX family)